MSSDKAKALPAFQAKWSTRLELTSTLCHLMDKPETYSSDDIAGIGSFVISLYSVTCRPNLTDEVSTVPHSGINSRFI